MIKQLAKFIEQREGYFEGTRAYRNNSPGNFRATPYIYSLGAIKKDKDGFAVFESYQDGFDALCEFLIDVCNRRVKPYHIFNSRNVYHKKLLPAGKDGDELPELTLVDFCNIYAPSFENDSDGYAEFLAEKLGVSKDIKIKELL